MRTRTSLLLALLTALALVTAFAPSAAARSRLVQARLFATQGTTAMPNCGGPVNVLLTSAKQPAMVHRIDTLLPAVLPAPVNKPYVHLLPFERLTLTFADGHVVVYAGTPAALPRSLVRVIALIRPHMMTGCPVE